MSIKNYMLLCVVVSFVVVLAIVFMPGVANSIESELLTFLSTNARE